MTAAAARHAEPACETPSPARFFATLGTDPLACAFPRKSGAHPGTPTQPLPADQRDAEWRRLLATPRNRRTVAYVHLPFCENHCLFCGFYQNPWRPEAGGPYVDALIAQLAAFARHPACEGPPLQAVYLGGGTPTALSGPDLARLVRAIRQHLPLASDCEITLEGRIHSFGLEKARAAFDAGVTRISLGVQSFDATIRRPLGRKASRAEILAALAALVALDQGAVIVDLIYGLPGQCPEDVAADVRLCAELGLDGLDLYALNLIPGTPLLTALEKGKKRVAGPEALGHFFAAGEAAAEEMGWAPISTSHWQGSLRERSVYNLAVKTGADCLAFGAGAGGALGGLSFRLGTDLRQYNAQAGSCGAALLAGMMRQARSARVADAIKAGMERGRLDLARVEAAFAALIARPALPLAEHLAPLLAQWREAGLWQPQHRFHHLTRAGRFWQVPMTTRLLGWMAEHPDLTPEPEPAK
ncbi:heme anaerobic degradation radical SAM methyltransferase ChuW/HutW [Rhodobacter maris]|uniref:Anaerobic coproporphyrinogen III oxidase n=1 Tax=Rhodobacter maris TaxID=446682 RepID=A0A285RFC4_9RHOB|nr:heme anaerobic degradation radical SAM methyltransferase ChuW/HutW [Rhodobacter maris]SOB92751.1 anaerobic coproporphyrinogen III oxidase [Rhodobacter maris]